MEAAPSLPGLRSELQIQIQYSTNTHTTIFTYTAKTLEELLEELFFPFYAFRHDICPKFYTARFSG